MFCRQRTEYWLQFLEFADKSEVNDLKLSKLLGFLTFEVFFNRIVKSQTKVQGRT